MYKMSDKIRDILNRGVIELTYVKKKQVYTHHRIEIWKE